MKYVRQDQVIEIIRRATMDMKPSQKWHIIDTVKEMPAVDIITSTYGMLVKRLEEKK